MFNIHETVKVYSQDQEDKVYRGVHSLCDCNRSLYTLGNAISKMKIPELTEYELEEERKVEGIGLPDLYDKCTC